MSYKTKNQNSRRKIIIGIASLLLMAFGFLDIGILGMEVNPGAMHFLNGLLFISLLFQLESKSYKVYGFAVVLGIMLLYEIVRHIATSYLPIGIFHFTFYLLYTIIAIQIFKTIREKKPKPIISIYSITYLILGLISMLAGHRLVFGWEWF